MNFVQKLTCSVKQFIEWESSSKCLFKVLDLRWQLASITTWLYSAIFIGRLFHVKPALLTTIGVRRAWKYCYVRQRHLSERGGKAKSPMNLGCTEDTHSFWWRIQNPRLKGRGMAIGLMLRCWFGGMNSFFKTGTHIMIFTSERHQMNNVLPVRGHSAGKSCNARLPHDTHALHLVNGYSWRQNIIKHDNFLQ